MKLFLDILFWFLNCCGIDGQEHLHMYIVHIWRQGSMSKLVDCVLTHCSCTACGVFLFSYILRNQANSSSPSSSVILARIDPGGFRADSWESLLPSRCFDCGIRLRFDWVMTRSVHLLTWHCHRLYTFGTKKKFQNLGKSGPVGRPETRSLFVWALLLTAARNGHAAPQREVLSERLGER